MRCPNCNKEIDDNSVFCKHCGKQIDVSTQHSTPTSKPFVPSHSPSTNKRNPKFALSFLVALLVLVLLGGVWYFVNESYNDTSSYSRYDDDDDDDNKKSERTGKKRENKSSSKTQAPSQSTSVTHDDSYYYDDEVSVAEEVPSERLSVSRNSVEFSADGGSQYVYVTASPSWWVCDWGYESDWWEVDGIDSDGFYIDCDYNPDETRYDYIMITNGYKQEYISITQY